MIDREEFYREAARQIEEYNAEMAMMQQHFGGGAQARRQGLLFDELRIPIAEPPRTPQGPPAASGGMRKADLCEECGAPLSGRAPIGCTSRLHPPEHPTMAERMVRAIMDDLKERPSLGSGWSAMAERERSEALEAWVEIVRCELNS